MANEGWSGVTDAVDLKIKPKVCRMCGHKYIPTGGNQKYCQECRKKMTKKPAVSKLKKDTEAVFGPGSYKGDEDPEEHHAGPTPKEEEKREEHSDPVCEKKAPARAEDQDQASARCIDLELSANGKIVARLMIDKDTAAGAVRLAEIIRTVKEILC